MARYDAMAEDYEEVAIFDIPALFTPLRIDRSTVPCGYHLYELRHDDDCWCDVVQLAQCIIVNHHGTLITRDEIELPPDGYFDIDPDDLNFGTGDCQGLREFMAEYPPLEGGYADG